jgi:outer membrane protein assembly factor BamB
MQSSLIRTGIPIAVGLLAIALLADLLVAERSVPPPAERLPGVDIAPGQRGPGEAPAVNLSGTFSSGTGAPSKHAYDWPNFRGLGWDDVGDDVTPLARTWPAEGPPRVWSLKVAEGYAGAAILRGRVYVLDYDATAQRDVLRCLSLTDGKEIWNRSYPVKIKRNHGITRTVPAATDCYAVSLGPKCHVICADAIEGQFKWGIDLVREYQARVPPWYAGQCPLIDRNRAILAPGGEDLMIAVDCATGKVIWKTPNPNLWSMTHSSIIPMEFAGRRMYVYCASGGVVGVSAEDGAILWETAEWKVNIATVPSPVPCGDGKILLTGGYNAGSLMLQLEEKAGKIEAQTLFRLPPTVFGSDQQTPIFYKGHIYGVAPGGELVCLDLRGKRVWSSGSERRFGMGPYLIADGLLFAMNNNGNLTIAEATPERFKPLAQARVLEGPESWGPMAIANGFLIVRDTTHLVCLDVRNK